METEFKYEGYIHRQNEMVARTARLETKAIPDWIDYAEIAGLKKEAQLKLAEIRPATIGQANRVSGVTPADIALLTVWIERGRVGEKDGKQESTTQRS